MSLTGWATKHKSRAVHSHHVLPHCHCFPRCPKNPWKTLDWYKTQFITNSWDRPHVHDRIHHRIHNWIHSLFQTAIVLPFFASLFFDWLKKCQFSLLPCLPVWPNAINLTGLFCLNGEKLLNSKGLDESCSSWSSLQAAFKTNCLASYRQIKTILRNNWPKVISEQESHLNWLDMIGTLCKP